MKKLFSWWMAASVASAAVACDFYIAIHENANPTGEQLLVACFFIVFFALFSLVCIGAHVEENVINKKEDYGTN